jgi:hypothetical protein
VGSAFFVFFFLEPTVNALGPQAGPVMGHITQHRKMPVVIVTSSLLTILAGILLYWRDSNGFELDWITSPVGLGFTIGAVAAIVAFALGFTMIKPVADRMGALAREVQGSGGPPSGEQAAEMQGLQHRLRAIGRVDTILLGIALVTMAVARYLG